MFFCGISIAQWLITAHVYLANGSAITHFTGDRKVAPRSISRRISGVSENKKSKTEHCEDHSLHSGWRRPHADVIIAIGNLQRRRLDEAEIRQGLPLANDRICNNNCAAIAFLRPFSTSIHKMNRFCTEKSQKTPLFFLQLNPKGVNFFSREREMS